MNNKNILSVIGGLITGILIYKYLFTSSSNHGPNSSEIKKNIYSFGKNECYRFKPIAYICPLRLNIN